MWQNIFRMSVKFPLIAMGSLIPVITLLIGIYRWKFLSRSSKYVFYFVLFFFLSDIPLWITAGLKIHNYKYYYIRDSLNLLIIGLIYLVGLKVKIRRLLVYFCVFLLVLVTSFQIFPDFSSGNYMWISRFVLVVLSLGYFSVLLSDLKVKDILFFPFFWFNAGVLMYSTSTLMVTFFYKFTFSYKIKNTFSLIFINMLEFMAIMFFVLIGIAFWVSKKNQKYIN